MERADTKMADEIFKVEPQEAERRQTINDIGAREKQLRIHYGVTFSTMEGFEVLKDLAIRGHFLATTYVQGDQMESAFRMGEHNMFFYILSHLSDELKSKILGG